MDQAKNDEYINYHMFFSIFGRSRQLFVGILVVLLCFAQNILFFQVGFRAERPELRRGGPEPWCISHWLIHQEWIQKRRNGSRDYCYVVIIMGHGFQLLEPIIMTIITTIIITIIIHLVCLLGLCKQMQDWPTGISQAKHSKTILLWFIDKNDEEPVETRALIWFQWEMYVFGTRTSELTN